MIVCKGNHKEDVCMVKPENKKGTCTHLMENKSAMIVPTKNVGPDSVVRILNTLIFREKNIAPDCERLENQFGVDKL
ncbi:hypothetical protein MtrunA17_Chr2g0316061 [Medicago truncatula]|nr:hypothetical protein MtrunA17_Chr2g0316061 [Medicago truncatula]